MSTVLLAHAGTHGPAFRAAVAARIAPFGVRAPVTTAGDLPALFASGTPATDGAALLAGTGATGGAIRDGRLARLVDGTGWLLGDVGSGFWIGHRVARAVVDDLDGGAPTRLTAALLERLDLADDREGLVEGRVPVLGRLITRLYAARPVELSRLAPLAFALAAEDGTAARIVRDAVAALTGLLGRVRREQPDGPLVLGGSVLVSGVLRLPPGLAAPLLDPVGEAPAIPVGDGLCGAAVLALRAGGTTVDAALHAVLADGVRAAGEAAAAVPPGPGAGEPGQSVRPR